MDSIQLLLKNEQAIKEAFRWENRLVQKFGALQWALECKPVDVKKVRETMDCMKQQTSVLSHFRNNNLFLIASAVTMEGSISLFDETLACYDRLKQRGFKRSVYLPYVAYFLATNVAPADVTATMDRALLFYKKMKEEHYWLTSKEDHMMAMILAHSHQDVEATIQEAEACYTYLNERGISKGNALQTMSHLLTLSPDAVSVKCDRLLAIEQALKANKIKLQSYSRSLVAILALLDVEVEPLVQQIAQMDRELSQQKGFGNFILGRSNRALFSVSLVSAPYLHPSDQQPLNATLQNSLQSILLAQQAAMIAAMSAAAASSAAASSSSN